LRRGRFWILPPGFLTAGFFPLITLNNFFLVGCLCLAITFVSASFDLGLGFSNRRQPIFAAA
jgi:hypothetical protein